MNLAVINSMFLTSNRGKDMGDDAEYYIEQQDEEARFNQVCQYATNLHEKVLLCWINGVKNEIWSWEPMNKVFGVFSNLHQNKQIGSDCFLVNKIPNRDDEDWKREYENLSDADNHGEIRIIDKLEFYVANNEADATFEVIALSRNDADLLREEAAQQKRSAINLKEVMLAEMLEEIVSVIESDVRHTIRVFAREL